MKPYDDEDELTTYVWNHFSRYFTPAEHNAGWAVYADAQVRIGRPRIAEMILRTHKLAEDSAVTAELADGAEAFRRRVARRVLRDHAAELFVNRCPECGRIVRTPKALQCLWCSHDWHKPTASQPAR